MSSSTGNLNWWNRSKVRSYSRRSAHSCLRIRQIQTG
jgi:hypothetical protein